MKKPLILFIIAAVLIVVAKLAYTKYCASKREGCKEEKFEEKFLPEDHVDY